MSTFSIKTSETRPDSTVKEVVESWGLSNHGDSLWLWDKGGWVEVTSLDWLKERCMHLDERLADRALEWASERKKIKTLTQTDEILTGFLGGKL